MDHDREPNLSVLPSPRRIERAHCNILQAAFDGQDFVSFRLERVFGLRDDAFGPVLGDGDMRAAECGCEVG